MAGGFLFYQNPESMSYFVKAHLGDAYAQRRLAQIYKIGGQTEKAISWYIRAGEGGNSEAFNILGNIYATPHGVEKDLIKAVGYYEKSAEMEEMFANENLAAIYYRGDLGAPDFQKSLNYYLKAADLGSKQAMYFAGQIYQKGFGNVPMDVEKAIPLFQESLDNGFEPAAFFLGLNYMQGVYIKRDLEKAGQLLERGAAFTGDEAAQETIAIIFERASDRCRKVVSIESNEWASCLLVVGRKDADIQYIVGNMYHRGIYVEKDQAKANKYMKLSADQGNQNAIKFLSHGTLAGH